MTLARRGFLLTTLAATGGFCASPLGQVDLDRSRGVLVVNVTIDGQTARMVLDTGAQRTVLTTAGRQRLNLPQDPMVSTTLRGAGGQLDTHPNANARNMTIGGVQLFQNQPREMLSLPVAAIPLDGIDGLLGSDMLRHHTLVVDVPGGRLSLLPNGSCSAGYDDVKLTLFERTLPLADVMVDRSPLLALLDTGASQSLINARGMHKLLLSSQAISDDPALQSLAVGGEISARAHQFASLQIGQVKLEKPTLSVISAVNPTFDMLIGLDVLARQVFTLSYGTQSLAFG